MISITDIKVARAHREDLLSLMKSRYPDIPVSIAAWMREKYKEDSVVGEWSVTKKEGYGYRTVLRIEGCPSLVITQLHEKVVDALFPEGTKRPEFLRTLWQEWIAADRSRRERTRLGIKLRVSSFEPTRHPEVQDTDPDLRESALESGYRSIDQFHDEEYLCDKHRNSEHNSKYMHSNSRTAQSAERSS
jgi:hypothetical protein